MAEPQVSDVAIQWQALRRLMHRRFWTVLTFWVITVLVVAVGSWLQTPIYRATASVLIDVESPQMLAISTTQVQPTLGQTQSQTYDDYYRTQIELIRSRTIAQGVYRNLELQKQPRYTHPTGLLATLLGLVQVDPIAMLLKQVKVEPVRQTWLVKIHVEDPDPKQAARIANEFAVVFSEENLAKAAAAEGLTLMKNEYLKLQSKEAELSKRYQAKHPAMIRVRQEMDQLTRTIEQEMQRQLRNDRRQADSDSLTPDVPMSLVERLKERSLMGGLRPNNIRVQDPAQTPLKPAKPNKVLNLFLGFLLGLLGGIGMATAQELLDTSLKVPEDIEQDERLVLLGYVPRMDGLPVKASQKSRARYQCVQVDPSSPVAESYRVLRTSLLYAAPQGTARALVITSPGSEEGKTTTVSNLGIALAQSGAKVLLVDADLRKGRLQDAYQLQRTPGLSEFLIGQASFEEVVQPTSIDKLSVVASGTYPPNPSELIGSSKMQEFLKQATAQFDRVLLDTPPVIAVTDAVILAAMTQTVVAIVQSGKTPRQALRRLVTLCQEVRAKILGVILNNVPGREAPSYYGYAAAYAAYRYGSAQGKTPSPRAS